MFFIWHAICVQKQSFFNSNDTSYLFDPIPEDKLDLLTKEELIALYRGESDLIRQMQKYIEELLQERLKEQQKSFNLGEKLINIRNKLFGRSSEKSKKGKNNNKKDKEPKKRVRLPSERYKNLSIVEKELEFDECPGCPHCQLQLKKSGLFEVSEYLTFIPRRYYVVREKRHKYRCGSCHSTLITTPAIPRIIPGGAYSDEMIIDVAMSKFLDLLPIERYVQMALRQGLNDLPANSLIQTTHKLADTIEASYKIIKEEFLEDSIVHADETPHRMLEGDKKSNWYLWGFSSHRASYFEIRDTRSGDVASDLLVESQCKYFMSDVYSGYKKAIREANEQREEKIIELNCNAHARRKFNDSKQSYEKEGDYFIGFYKRIYRLEDKDYIKGYCPYKRRQWQKLYMRLMEKKAIKQRAAYSKHSSFYKACTYLINNFESLVRFSEDPILPIDNNTQERQLRPPVVGRKTWYGTHSKRGAKTMAIMFSIVQSCKLNDINPREFVTNLVRALHQGRPAYSPYQYKKIKENEET